MPPMALGENSVRLRLFMLMSVSFAHSQFQRPFWPTSGLYSVAERIQTPVGVCIIISRLYIIIMSLIFIGHSSPTSWRVPMTTINYIHWQDHKNVDLI